MSDTWVTVERPGYLGKKRDEVRAGWDAQHGAGRWRIAYSWLGGVIDRPMAIQLYEDAYCEFFRRNPDTFSWLATVASDVYDTAPSNAGQLDYDNQETPNNHIHDVAIRRSFLRLGKKFGGDRLVHVRWVGTEGFPVNPGVVPFHLPQHIDQHPLKDYGGKGIWWWPGTVEDFYQRNKLLQVRSSDS